MLERQIEESRARRRRAPRRSRARPLHARSQRQMCRSRTGRHGRGTCCAGTDRTGSPRRARSTGRSGISRAGAPASRSTACRKRSRIRWSSAGSAENHCSWSSPNQNAQDFAAPVLASAHTAVPPTVRPSISRVGWPTPAGNVCPALPQIPTPSSSAMSLPIPMTRVSTLGPSPIRVAPLTGSAILPSRTR